MNHLLKIAVGSVLAAMASGAALADVVEVRDVAVLWHTRQNAVTDNFYTTQVWQRDASLTCCGHVLVGPAAYVFADASPWNPYLAPLRRFYKGPPTTEHFYSIQGFEIDFVLANGYTPEGTEGAVYTQPMTGLVPFHRLNLFNPGTYDLQHFYTTSNALKTSYEQQGWSYDGPTGYVFAYRSPIVSGRAGLDRGGRLYVTAPAAVDSQLPVQIQGKCGGTMVVKAGSQTRELPASSFTYSAVPPGFNSWGCWSYVDINVSGSTTVNMTHTGFAARISRASGDFWTLTPAGSSSVTLSSSFTSTGKAASFDHLSDPVPPVATPAQQYEAMVQFTRWMRDGSKPQASKN